MKKISFSKKMVFASIFGIVVGAVLGKNTAYIKILGDIFINLISMMVPFLIFGALIESVMTLAIKDLGTIGGKTLSSFVFTSSMAGAIAILFGYVFQPGAGIMNIQLSEYTGNTAGMTVSEAILSFFPKNIFTAFNNNAITQIILFAVIVGVTISLYKNLEPVKRIHDFVLDMNVLIMKIVTLIMNFAPIGIFALTANMIGQNGIGILIPLLKAIVVITLANIVCLLIVGLSVSAYAKVSFFRMIVNVKRTIIVAATTTSSAMSLPMKFLDSEENMGVSKRISQFVNPLGGVLNTDGGVILTVLASMTVAQILGIELSFSAMVMLGVTAVLSSFGNTMVPGGGIVAMAIVFALNGIPLEGVALFAGIDWILAITRVPINVVDDVFCALYVAASEKELDRDVFYGRKEVMIDETANI
jgi:Na+/H+-dicarboxylate symporter